MSLLEAEVLWSSGTWERLDYSTIMSGRVVRYNIHYGKPGEVEISASRDAVCIDNVSFNSEEQRDALLNIIQRAWRQHLYLRKARGNDPLPEF